MKLPDKQKGLSSIGWLFLGITVFFYGIILVKIIPVYLDDLSVADAIKKIGKVSITNIDPTPEVIEALQKQLDIENVRDINVDKEGVLKVDRENGVITVEMNYDKTVSIFKNNGLLQTMDIVIRFKHKQTIR